MLVAMRYNILNQFPFYNKSPKPCYLVEFLQKSIPSYHKYNENLDLNALIYFIISSNSPTIALELQF